MRCYGGHWDGGFQGRHGLNWLYDREKQKYQKLSGKSESVNMLIQLRTTNIGLIAIK